MKGASPIVTYLLIAFVAFISLSLLTSLILSYYRNLSKSLTLSAFKQLAIYTSSEIAKMYNENSKSLAQPEINSLIVLSNETLNYPSKINGNTYKVEFVSNLGLWSFVSHNLSSSNLENSGNKILFRTLQDELIEYYFDLPNMQLEFQGSFESGEKPVMFYVRYNYNGTVRDRLILGESNVIVGLVGVN